MMRNIVLIALVMIVAACGVQRPLMRPKDIPAYEQKQREKREKIEQEMREDAEKAAAEKAAADGQAQ